MNQKRTNNKSKNLTLYLLFIITIIFHKLDAQTTWQSKLVKMDRVTGELSYIPDSQTGIRIPDFSRAGYKGGDAEIPNVPVKLTIGPIAGDNTLHIQKAINAVSELPINIAGIRGAVLLKPGIYNVSGILEIRTSGVVLRGSGSGNKTSSNTHIIGTSKLSTDRAVLRIGGLFHTQFKGMVPGTKTNIISSKVAVGDKSFRVSNASPFKVGDNIIIYHPCTAKWLKSVNGGDTGSDPSWTVDSQPIIYNTRIEKIISNKIFVNSPVFNTLDLSTSQSYIYKYDRKGLVENIGVENLRIDIKHDITNPDDLNHARSAIEGIQLENSWIRGFKLLHFSFAGIDLRTCNYLTISNCQALTPIGPTANGLKYNFCVSEGVQNTLFTNCTASKGRHAYVSNGASSVAGIVFHKCTSIDPLGSSEGHRRWTTGLLFDNFIDKGKMPPYPRVLAFINREYYGTGHGWASANCVAWNCNTTRANGKEDGVILVQRPPTAQNFAVGCKGIVSNRGPFLYPQGYIEGTNVPGALEPKSLYEAQIKSRKYLESLNNNISFEVISPENKWHKGSVQTIKWTFNQSSDNNTNCKYVNIKLSTNGGLTFPITIVQNTLNDGVYSYTVPKIAKTKKARIRIESVDKMCFDDTDTNFSISPFAGFLIFNPKITTPTNCSASSISYTFRYIHRKEFNGKTRFSASGFPENATVKFFPPIGRTTRDIKMTISNLKGVPKKKIFSDYYGQIFCC